MIEVKRPKKLIGQGVAIKCPNGNVEKFKVLAVRTTTDKDGERLDFVKLDLSEGLCYSFYGSPLVNKDLKDGIWFYPLFLYRNKGECARAHFEKKILQAAQLKVDWKKRLESFEKEFESRKKTFQEANDAYEKLVASYKKCKFARPL